MWSLNLLLVSGLTSPHSPEVSQVNIKDAVRIQPVKRSVRSKGLLGIITKWKIHLWFAQSFNFLQHIILLKRCIVDASLLHITSESYCRLWPSVAVWLEHWSDNRLLQCWLSALGSLVASVSGSTGVEFHSLLWSVI